MLDEHKDSLRHKSDSKLDASDRKRLEKLRAEMERVRQELEAFRKTTNVKDEDYAKLRDDMEYELMLRSGGFVQEEDGFVVKRIYPSLEEIFYERPPVIQDTNSINWKTINNKIYIKEFFEDDEKLQLELDKMKLNEPAGNTSTGFGKKIKVEIPKEFKQDFENFIGENLTLKIGVFSILLALILGYNLLISDGYIPQEARIVVGCFLGVGFFGLSYYLYLKKVSIVTILVLSGIFILYYTVYLAIHDYHIFTPIQAFACAITITGFAVFFSLWYDQRNLSIFAIFGGYFTPYLANTGGGHYLSFLIYILILNLGMLTISYLKNWRKVHTISFVSTVFFLIYWTSDIDKADSSAVLGMFGFIIIFHILFFMLTVLFDLKEGIDFQQYDFYLSLGNTVLLLVGGIYLLWQLPSVENTEIGWFLMGISAFKLFYVFLLSRHKNADQDLLDLQIGTVILLGNIAIYLVLKKNIYINTFYALESVALLWLGTKMRREVIKTGSAALMLFAIASMGYAWHLTYNVYPEKYPNETIYPIFNGGFWAGLVNFSTIVYTLKFLYEEYKDDEEIAYLPKSTYSSILTTVLLLIVYLTCLFDLLFHTKEIVGGSDYRFMVLAIYHMAYILLIRFVVEKARVEKLKLFVGTTMALAVILFLPIGYYATSDLRDGFVNGILPFYPYFVHYLPVGISGIMIYYLLVEAIKSEGYLSSKYEYAVLLACVAFVSHATMEFEHLFVLLSTSIGAEIEEVVSTFRVTSFTVLWTMLSFTLMYFGMQWKIKEIRKISLFLFGFTIFKFFIWDFWEMGAAGKIISFLVIGALLILVSQMYRQQLKLLIEKGELVFDRDDAITPEKAAAIAKIRKQMKDEGATEVEISDGEETGEEHFDEGLEESDG